MKTIRFIVAVALSALVLAACKTRQDSVLVSAIPDEAAAVVAIDAERVESELGSLPEKLDMLAKLSAVIDKSQRSYVFFEKTGGMGAVVPVADWESLKDGQTPLVFAEQDGLWWAEASLVTFCCDGNRLLLMMGSSLNKTTRSKMSKLMGKKTCPSALLDRIEEHEGMYVAACGGEIGNMLSLYLGMSDLQDFFSSTDLYATFVVDCEDKTADITADIESDNDEMVAAIVKKVDDALAMVAMFMPNLLAIDGREISVQLEPTADFVGGAMGERLRNDVEELSLVYDEKAHFELHLVAKRPLREMIISEELWNR